MGADDPTRPREEAPPSSSGLSVGGSIGRYVLVRLLGRGGSAEVYAAYDQRLQREVALKVLHRRVPHPDQTTAALRESWGALLREAQALARLSHPNVVTVHDVAVEQGLVLLSMERIEGSDLSTWLTGARSASPRSVAQRLAVLRGAGAGLHAAHAQGLLHRDFKPANVLVDPEGNARVLDFGLARFGHDASPTLENVGYVSTGHVVTTAAAYGTPAFMSPEQHRGEAGDVRTDVYAFCITAWLVLWGRLPFAARDLAGLGHAKLAGPPPRPASLAGVPRTLATLLRRGLAPNPADRPPSLAPLLVALRPVGRRRRAWVLGGAAAGVALGGISWGLAARLDGAPLQTTVPPRDPCAAAAEPVATLWSDAERARLGADFKALDAGWTVPARRIALRELDAYASSWTAAAEQACGAREDTAAPLALAREACLRERSDALAALLRGWKPLTLEAARRSAETIRSLPRVSVCADDRALARRPAVADDPVVAAAAREIRTLVTVANRFESKGEFPAALATASKAARKAEALGIASVLAEARYALAAMQANTGDDAGAETSMHAAVAAAQEARHDVVEADAWIYLVHLVGANRRHDEALRYAKFAEAALARIGSPPEALARLHFSRGSVLGNMGRLEDALEAYELARAIDVETLGERHSGGLPLLQHLGAVQTKLHRTADARATFALGLEVAIETLPPKHPTTARFHLSLAQILADQGHTALARPHFERALAANKHSLARGDPELARSYKIFAIFESEAGRHAEALAHLNAAVAVLDASSPPDPDGLALVLNEVCATRFRMKQLDEAWEACTRARRVSEARALPDPHALFTSVNRQAIVAETQGRLREARTLRLEAVEVGVRAWGATTDRIADPLLGAANVDIDLGEPVRAVPRLRRALALRRVDGSGHKQLAYNHWLLARVLFEADPGAARSHAADGLRIATERGDADAKTLLKAWIRAHPPSASDSNAREDAP